MLLDDLVTEGCEVEDLDWCEALFAPRGATARRTNFALTEDIRPARRSAMRSERWTSSTMDVRRASIVFSKRRMDVWTSDSLPPRAND